MGALRRRIGYVTQDLSLLHATIRENICLGDETLSEQGQAVSPPIRRAAAIAVIANPFAGKYQEDLSELIDVGEELGGLLAERAVAALGAVFALYLQPTVLVTLADQVWACFN